MIEIVKGGAPKWIMSNQDRKTAEYIAAPAASKPSPWRADEVVVALKVECSKKCMYCESFIDDTSYSAVEHIRPKKIFENLVLEWTNLGLTCSRCNTNKGSYWSENLSLQLLNPYRDAIEQHLAFRGPLTVATLDSSRGENTVRKLRLNSREDLLISRMRRIEELHSKLRIWHSELNPELKELYAEDVSSAVAREREYSGVLRAYALEAGFPVG
ncbi:HNH endonuclease [Arthrobacter flavus]|uniref:HNH endonuclease n=1 Tax=Arthrobacter flavus TaxID=95172 RepID=A0ABW4Q7S7_9MICC